MYKAAVRLAAAATVAIIAVGIAACDFPRDPEGTLDHVQGGTMRVGVTDHPPWVDLSGPEPSGVEPELLREFAASQDAEIEWVEGPESELIAALTGYQLDVVAGGLTQTTPWAKEVSITLPYVDTEIVFAVPPGEELPELEGAEIYVKDNSEEAGLLQQEEKAAHPIHYDSFGEIDGPALLDSYYIEALGFERAGQIQRDDDHVMAVAPGENAFLLELGNFLFDHTEEAERILLAEAEREVGQADEAATDVTE
jgi:polar amino acid transport system substrate-binding protein